MNQNDVQNGLLLVGVAKDLIDQLVKVTSTPGYGTVTGVSDEALAALRADEPIAQAMLRATIGKMPDAG